MAVRDLWTLRDGSPSKRAGRGLRWRVDVPGHPVEHFAHKGVAERRERALWDLPKTVTRGETVGDMVAVWRAGKAGLSPKGLEAVGHAAQVVLGRWETVRLRDVDRDDVAAWIANLSTDRGPASASLRHKAMQCLRGSLDVAVRRKLLIENPAAGVRIPKQRVREGRFLTVAELRRLVDEIGDHYAPMVWLMATTGMRVGEVCALNVGDVDVSRRRIRVRQAKGEKPRDVAVGAWLLELLDLERGRDAPLFTLQRSGGRVTKDPWRARHFSPAVERAKLGDVRVHDLRHTAASLAIESGASVMAVQRMLGHESASITLGIYGHLWDESLDDVAARMADLVAVPGTGGEEDALSDVADSVPGTVGM